MTKHDAEFFNKPYELLNTEQMRNPKYHFFNTWEEWNALFECWFRVNNFGLDGDQPNPALIQENHVFQYYVFEEDGQQWRDAADRSFFTTFKGNTRLMHNCQYYIDDVSNPKDLCYFTIEITKDDYLCWDDALYDELYRFICNMWFKNPDWSIPFCVFHTDDNEFLAHVHFVACLKQNHNREIMRERIAQQNRAKDPYYYKVG